MPSLPTVRIEDVPAHASFCHLSKLQGVQHDLRYAGSNNFANRVLYGSDGGNYDCAWLRTEAALALEAAAAWLATQRPGWQLLVLDALRPQRVQEAIWADVRGTPAQDYFADPVRGSIHSYGMAVDVTLLDETGTEQWMGSGFDEMTEASHPELHPQLLASGALLPHHVALRELLHSAMARHGFAGIPNEWWHFDHGDKARVRRELPRVY
jgi:zinc D-Ala-D-Ala dipeptidase